MCRDEGTLASVQRSRRSTAPCVLFVVCVSEPSDSSERQKPILALLPQLFSFIGDSHTTCMRAGARYPFPPPPKCFGRPTFFCVFNYSHDHLGHAHNVSNPAHTKQEPTSLPKTSCSKDTLVACVYLPAGFKANTQIRRRYRGYCPIPLKRSPKVLSVPSPSPLPCFQG